MTLSKERLGNFTASEVHKLFVGGKGVTRDTYVFEKAEERIRGHAKGYSSKDMEHGQMNEFEAISNFKLLSGLNVDYLEQEYFSINANCGATPDAKVVDFKGKIIASVDVKCPTETFFKQKMQMITKGKPEYQNTPKEYYYQAQMQMMALNVKEHYLVRYMTSKDMDYDGNVIEYDLPLETRLFWKLIKADPDVQFDMIQKVEQAAKERDTLIRILKTPI